MSGKITDFLVTLQADRGIFLLDQPSLNRCDQSDDPGLAKRDSHRTAVIRTIIKQTGFTYTTVYHIWWQSSIFLSFISPL